MSRKNQKTTDPRLPLRHNDHGRPLTRRQFLGQGFVGGSAMVAGLSMLDILGRSTQAYAQAVDCGIAAGGAGKVPFLAFDLAGGASIAGSNVIVGGAGGQTDFISADGYKKLGLPADMLPTLTGQTNNELGLMFHADSALLRGILSKTTPETRANVNGVVIAARSENDTGNNPHNPVYGIARAGANGDLVGLIGTNSSDSGGRSRAPESMIDPTLKPTKIASPEDATGLVDTGKLVSLLNQQDAARVMLAVERLSALKINKINESQLIKQVLTCGYQESASLVSRYGNPDILDPTSDSIITQIFPGDEINDNKFSKTASVMKLVIDGFAGAGTIQFGGYDYHNSTRATGETRDFEAGQAIGAALQFAAARNRPLMIYVFSDGSVSSNGEIDDSEDGRGKGIWKNDSASTSAVFFLVYNPAGRPTLTAPDKQQLGYFRASGDIETSATAVSNNVDLLAEAIVLNYLALHGEVGRFGQVLPNNSLNAATRLDDLIAFQPIA